MHMKQQHSFWFIALLALVFLGQSLAVAAMPCQMMDAAPESHEVNHDMGQMDHSMHHDMSQMDHSQNPSGDMNTIHDCCKTLGHCSSSSCSAPGMTYDLTFNLSSNNLLVASGYHQHIPNSPVSSLYRPPIFC